MESNGSSRRNVLKKAMAGALATAVVAAGISNIPDGNLIPHVLAEGTSGGTGTGSAVVLGESNNQANSGDYTQISNVPATVITNLGVAPVFSVNTDGGGSGTNNPAILAWGAGTGTPGVMALSLNGPGLVSQCQAGGNYALIADAANDYRAALFENTATSGDRTALVDWQTGDSPTPNLWRVAAAGAGNGLSIPEGSFYFEHPAGIPLMTLGPTGNLGIGTTSPSYSLDTTGAIRSTGGSPQIQAAPPSNADARMLMRRPDRTKTGAFEFDTGGQSYQWLFGNFYNQDSFTVDYWDGTSDHFWFNVQQNGNVGIGTTTPAYTLDVAGQVHATGFPTSSDVRFKEDIHPIDNALEKVLRLNGVYFRWNRLHRETLKRSHNLTSRQVGLVAQQVREVVPELVSEWADQGAEDYLAVDYSRLGALTIEAIKQLNDKNDKLEAENKTMREEIKTLQETLRRLAAS